MQNEQKRVAGMPKKRGKAGTCSWCRAPLKEGHTWGYCRFCAKNKARAYRYFKREDWRPRWVNCKCCGAPSIRRPTPIKMSEQEQAIYDKIYRPVVDRHYKTIATIIAGVTQHVKRVRKRVPAPGKRLGRPPRVNKNP